MITNKNIINVRTQFKKKPVGLMYPVLSLAKLLILSLVLNVLNPM